MDSFTCRFLIEEIHTSYHNCNDLIFWKKQLDMQFKFTNQTTKLKNHLKKGYKYRKYRFYVKTFQYLSPYQNNYDNIVFCLCKILDIYHGKIQKLKELEYLYHSMVQFENTWL